MNEVYRFDEGSYDALGAAGIGWQSALEVLHARRRVRQHVGGVLRIAGQDRAGRWLAVALIEDDEDEYLVVSGRELDDDEAKLITGMMSTG